MRMIGPLFVGLLLLPAFSNAQAVKPEEFWEAIYARDKQNQEQLIGHVRTVVEPIQVDGNPRIRTTREMTINMRRDGQRVQLKLAEGTEETNDGKVTAVFMKTYQGPQVVWEIFGTVIDKELQIKQTGAVQSDRKIPWDTEVISVRKEIQLPAQKKIKPGDTFDYKVYASTIGVPVLFHATVEREEDTAIAGKEGTRKLLRVETEMEPVNGFQLPGTTSWFDPQTRELVMTQTLLPDLGQMTFVRTTKEIATGPIGTPPDIVQLQSIRLAQRIKGDIHELSSVVYKVSLRGKGEPSKIFREDVRQTIRNVKDRTFDLTVQAVRRPTKLDKIEAVDEEYLKANHFIDSDDPAIQKLAQQAIGNEKDPWKQAQKIEKFVRTYIQEVTYTQALDTATQVAKSRQGDCTEFAMLCAALCRAVKIPSRTAVGLIYVDRTSFSEAPVLAFHMWTEVYVAGQWLGLDATLARGSIGPGHIKITDHSWKDVKSFAPLLPVNGFIMARPTVTITGATK